MNKEELKRSLLAKLPEGALRELVPEGDEDNLYSGIAEALEEVAGTLDDTADTRDPLDTVYSPALQREYGFLPDEDLSDEDQRNRVKALKYAKRGSGTAEAMQEALRIAGFTQLEVVEIRKDDSITGGLIAAQSDIVVNGFETISQMGYPVTCEVGLSVTCADPPDYTCTERNLIQVGVPYEISSNWNLAFLVSSGIVVDEDGYILNTSAPEIAWYYRNMIKEIILRLKPNGTWGLLSVDWIDEGEGYGFGFFPMGISAHGL